MNQRHPQRSTITALLRPLVTVVPLFAVVTSALVACGGASLEQLRARVAFDFHCPGAQVSIVPIDERTRGVSGCGRQATYIENCAMTDVYGGKHNCTWVQNSDAHTLA